MSWEKRLRSDGITSEQAPHASVVMNSAGAGEFELRKIDFLNLDGSDETNSKESIPAKKAAEGIPFSGRVSKRAIFKSIVR